MVQMSGQNLRNKPERAANELNSESKGDGISSSSEEKLWTCNICVENEIYADFHAFTLHMETHIGGYPSRCRVCFAQFATPSELGTHIKNKHITGLQSTAGRLRSETNNNLDSEWNAAANSNKGDSILVNDEVTDRENPSRRCSRLSPNFKKHRRNDLSTSTNTASEVVASKCKPIRTFSKSYGTASRRKKHIPLINYCCLCKVDFECYDAWRKHAVFEHIISKKPFPIVEMNYVDVTASQAGVPTAITTTSKEGITKELKLTFSKAKGSYVVKKCSISSDSEGPDVALSSASTSTEVLSSSEGFGLKDNFEKDFSRHRKHRSRRRSSSSSNTSAVNSEKQSLLERRLQSGISLPDTGKEKIRTRSSSTDICDNETDSFNGSIDKENNFPSNKNSQIELSIIQNHVSNSAIEDSSLCDEEYRTDFEKDTESHSLITSHLQHDTSEGESAFPNAANAQTVVEFQSTEAVNDDICAFTSSTAVSTNSNDEDETIRCDADYNFCGKESTAEDSYILGLATEKEVNTQLLMGHEGIELSISQSILPITNEEGSDVMISEENPSVSAKSVMNSSDVFTNNIVHPISPNTASESAQGHSNSSEISPGTDEENGFNGDEDLTAENHKLIRPRSQAASVHSENTDIHEEEGAEDGDLDSRDNDDIPNDNLKDDGCTQNDNEIADETDKQKENEEECVPSPNESNSEEIITGDGIVSDEFQCKVCHQNFDSDDDLEEHFAKEHFRVSISSNLLEPESPYPPSVLSQSMDTSDSGIESNTVENHSPHTQILNLQNRQEQGHTDDNGLAQLLMRGNGVIANPMHPSHRGNPMTMSPNQANQYQHNVQPRPMIPPRNLSPISPPTQFGPGIPAATRPTMSTAQVNFLMNQHVHPNHQMGPRSSMGPGRPSLAMNPSSLQQRMGNISVTPGHHHNNMYPTSLHHALTNPNDSQNRRMPPPATIRHNPANDNGPRIIEVSSMQRPQLYANQMNISQSYQQQQQVQQQIHQQHQQQQQQQQQQQRYIHQQLQQQQQLQIQQRQQMMHQQQQAAALKQQQAHLQQQQVAMRCDDQQQMIRVTNVRGGAQVQPIRHTSILQGKRTASTELNEHDRVKQARLENSVASGGMQMTPTHFVGPRSRMPVAVNQGTSSEVTITPRVNVGQVINAPDTPPPLDRNVAAAIGSVGTAGLNSVRLGTSITLSVCPGNETMGQNGRCSSGGSSGSLSPVVINSSSVANALAVRGVTVTPASPPTAVGRGSPNCETSPRSSPTGPYSVIRSAPPNSISPVRNYSPPNMVSINNSNNPLMGFNQFAVPKIPAPRASLSSPGSLVNNSTERPSRPPTVDLTDDDVMQHNLENQGRAVRSMEPSRHMSRPPFSCSACHMNFNTPNGLESHRYTVHGAGNPNLVSAIRGPQPPIQRANQIPVRDQRINPNNSLAQITRTLTVRPPPPQLQQMRGQMPSQSSSPNPKYLYIPLLDLSRLDANKLQRLEDLGISNVVPLHGNEAAAGQMGIPIMNLRSNGQSAHVPWDCVLPVGPTHTTSNFLGNSNNSTSGQSIHMNRPH